MDGKRDRADLDLLRVASHANGFLPRGLYFPFIDLSDAKDESFIFLKPEQRFYRMGMDLCKAAGFRPNILYELTNWDAINTLIGVGMGVALRMRFRKS